MATAGTYSSSGNRLYVNDLTKDPLLIRSRMLDMARNQFMMEDILRRVPDTQSGVIQWTETTPLFASSDPGIVAEGGEIQLIQGEDGVPRAAFTVKIAGGIEITRETRDRNRIDQVNKRMTQVRNSMTRVWERRMFNALDSAPTLSGVASGDWSLSGTDIRQDVLEAMRAVEEANASDTPAGPDVDDYLGYEPDTLVMSTRTATSFFGNSSVREMYQNGSPITTKDPMYTGTLEREFMGMRVLTSRFMQDGFVWIMERKTVGGFSDERRLEVKPLYEDKTREVWRTDVVRRSAIFVDEPKAAFKLDILP